MSKDTKNNIGEENTGDGNSGDGNSGNGNSGDGNSGNGNSGNRNSGDWNSGNGNSGDWNSGNGNSGDWNSGYRNSGDWNSGYRNSGYGNSGHWNSGYGNSGHWNSGNRNSGIFNTNEPKMRIFNKECNLTYTEFRERFGYKDIDFSLNVWVDKEDMTKDEKKSVKGWEQTGGYLKSMSYKEAWQEGWKNATQEQKDWYKSLPNFDPDIFKEITGIKIDEPEEMIEIDGKKYSKGTIKEALKKHCE